MLNLIRVLALGILASLALGQVDSRTSCMQGIRSGLGIFYFAGGNVFSFWDNLCANPLRITSLYAAGKVYCTKEEIEAGSALLEESCLLYGEIPAIPYSAVEANLTEEYINSLPKLTYEDVGVKLLLNEVYMMDEDYFQLSFKTAVRGRT